MRIIVLGLLLLASPVWADEPIYAIVDSDESWTSQDHYLLKHISDKLDEISKKLDAPKTPFDMMMPKPQVDNWYVFCAEPYLSKKNLSKDEAKKLWDSFQCSNGEINQE